MAEPARKAQRYHVLDGVEAAPGAAFEPDGAPTFQMRRAPAADRHVLRIPAATAGARGALRGFDISQPINAARGHETLMSPDPRASLRLGPDEWLLIGPLGAQDGPAAGMLVDVSHRNVAIDVRGTQVRDVLNTGVPLDLDDVGFPVGTATRTLFAKAEIVLVRCEDQDGIATFRLECWRSFARYLVGHLTQSAALLGFGRI
jgi:sarcosine oxidase subunit gamma